MEKDLNRLLQHISFKDDAQNCWIWTGNTPGEYGQAWLNKKRMPAHVAIYTLLVGTVPKGLQLDHVVCKRKTCVNPSHMEPVTSLINNRRRSGLYQDKTGTWCCKSGHKLEGYNIILESTGARRCRICRNEYNKRYMRNYRG